MLDTPPGGNAPPAGVVVLGCAPACVTAGPDHNEAIDAPNFESEANPAHELAFVSATFGCGVDMVADPNGLSDVPASDCEAAVKGDAAEAESPTVNGGAFEKSVTANGDESPKLVSSSTGEPSCTSCNVLDPENPEEVSYIPVYSGDPMSEKFRMLTPALKRRLSV